MIRFDDVNARDWVLPHETAYMIEKAERAWSRLHKKVGPGENFLGWMDLPSAVDRNEYQTLISCAKNIRSHSDLLVVVGIGGSYLGAKAVIDALDTDSYGLDAFGKGEKTKILYAGHHLSGPDLHRLIQILPKYDFSINVISKSGTTTEPAIAFRLLKACLEEKYGKAEASRRIIATTDREKGALKKLADENGYQTFVIPDDVGGRFSVLTPVGLLPMAVAGLDTRALLQGAGDMRHVLANEKGDRNPALRYAALRNGLYQKGFHTELLVNYEPRLHYFTEWWKQLYGESEGKDGKGIFPAGVDFTTDLHSLGQYIQAGRRFLFETVLQVEKPTCDISIDPVKDDVDGLNYLAGKTLDMVNKTAARATSMAHVKGGVPNVHISMERLDEICMGALIYFFEMACGVSGYMLGVNPFDQPGVEEYKANMFRLLEKPGYNK